MLPSLLALPSPIPLNLKHHPLSLDQINTPELYWSGIMYLKITEQQERTKIGMFNIAILPSLSFHPVPPPPDTHTAFHPCSQGLSGDGTRREKRTLLGIRSPRLQGPLLHYLLGYSFQNVC